MLYCKKNNKKVKPKIFSFRLHFRPLFEGTRGGFTQCYVISRCYAIGCTKKKCIRPKTTHACLRLGCRLDIGSILFYRLRYLSHTEQKENRSQFGERSINKLICQTKEEERKSSLSSPPESEYFIPWWISFADRFNSIINVVINTRCNHS